MMDDFDSHDDPLANIAPLGDGADDCPPEPPEIAGASDEVMAFSASQPLNDYGNGQRFVTHFGEDVMSVPRVGWFIWNGQVWEKDPDHLEVRRRAQSLSDII